jgi:hypothetical protein
MYDRIYNDPEMTEAQIEMGRDIDFTDATTDKMLALLKRVNTGREKEYKEKVDPALRVLNEYWKRGHFNPKDADVDDKGVLVNAEDYAAAETEYTRIIEEFEKQAKDYDGKDIINDVLMPLLKPAEEDKSGGVLDTVLNLAPYINPIAGAIKSGIAIKDRIVNSGSGETIAEGEDVEIKAIGQEEAESEKKSLAGVEIIQTTKSKSGRTIHQLADGRIVYED